MVDKFVTNVLRSVNQNLTCSNCDMYVATCVPWTVCRPNYQQIFHEMVIAPQ